MDVKLPGLQLPGSLLKSFLWPGAAMAACQPSGSPVLAMLGYPPRPAQPEAERGG